VFYIIFGEVAELAEGNRLLSGCRGLNLYPGFESLPLRTCSTRHDRRFGICAEPP
jgi:hypothetical protein